MKKYIAHYSMKKDGSFRKHVEGKYKAYKLFPFGENSYSNMEKKIQFLEVR